LKKQRSNRSRREDAPALIEMTARRDRQKRTKLVEHRSYRSRREGGGGKEHDPNLYVCSGDAGHRRRVGVSFNVVSVEMLPDNGYR
jgi:hypothetical protein